MDDVTKKYKKRAKILSILSFIVLFVPLIVYIVMAFANGGITVSKKVILGFSLIFALVLTIINALTKFRIRSTIWIILLGIYYCLNNILPLLLMIAIGTITDEFILSPLQKKNKRLYEINNEIDKRNE